MPSGAGTSANKASTTSQLPSSHGRSSLWSPDASSSSQPTVQRAPFRHKPNDLNSRTRCKYCRRRVTVAKNPLHEVACPVALNSPDYVRRKDALCPDCLALIKPSQPEGLCLNDFTLHRRVCPTPTKTRSCITGRKPSSRPTPESDDESLPPMPSGGYTPDQLLSLSTTMSKCFYCFKEVTALTKDRHEFSCLEAAGLPLYLPRMKALCSDCRSFIRATSPRGLSIVDWEAHVWKCPERKKTSPSLTSEDESTPPFKAVSPPRAPVRIQPAPTLPLKPKVKAKAKAKATSARPSPESEDDPTHTPVPPPQTKPKRATRRVLPPKSRSIPMSAPESEDLSDQPLARDEYVRRKAELSAKATCDYCNEHVTMLTVAHHLVHRHWRDRDDDAWPRQGICPDCLCTVEGAGPSGMLRMVDFGEHDVVCRGHEKPPRKPATSTSTSRPESPLVPKPTPELERTKEEDYGGEAERYALFAGDPRIAQVEEYRVMCAACGTWVESKGEVPYWPLAWMEHKKGCGKMKKTSAGSSSGRLGSGGAEGRRRREHDMEGVEATRSNITVRSRAATAIASASSSAAHANGSDQDITIVSAPNVPKPAPAFVYPPEAASAPIPSTRQLTPPTPNPVQSRRTEEERISFLRRDPNVGEIEPHRVFCKMCERWIQLRKNSTYCTAPWVQHVWKCERKHGVEGDDGEMEALFGDEVEEQQRYAVPTPVVPPPGWPGVHPVDPPRYIVLSPAPGQAQLDPQPYPYPPPLPSTAKVYAHPVQGQGVVPPPQAQTRLQARQAGAGAAPLPTSQAQPSHIIAPLPPPIYPPHGHTQGQIQSSSSQVETLPPAMDRRYGIMHPDPTWSAPPTATAASTVATATATATVPLTSNKTTSAKGTPRGPGRPRKKLGPASGPGANGLFTTQVLREDVGGRYERSGLSASVNAGLSNGAAAPERTTGLQQGLGMVQRVRSPTPEVLHPREGERYVTVVTPPEFSMYQYYSTSQYDDKEDSYALYFEAPPGHPAVMPLRRSESASDRSSGQDTPQKQQKIWLVYKLKNFGDNVCPTRRRKTAVGTDGVTVGGGGGAAVIQGQGQMQGQALNQAQSQVNDVQAKSEEERVVFLGRGEVEREREGLPVYRSGTWPHLMDPVSPTEAGAPTTSGEGKSQGSGNGLAHANVLVPYQGRDERDPVAPPMSSEVSKKKRKKGEEVEGGVPKRRRVSDAAGDIPEVETRRERESEVWDGAKKRMWVHNPWPPNPAPPPPPHLLHALPPGPPQHYSHSDRPPARPDNEWRPPGPPEPPRGKDLESAECRLQYTFGCIAWLYKTQHTRGGDITLDVLEAFMNDRLGRKEFGIMELKGFVNILWERKSLTFTEEGLQLLREHV